MPKIETSTTPGVELFYQDCGAPTDPVVVLLHGWPLSWRMWEPQIEPLVAAGFRVIAYDRRGFGASSFPWDGYDYDTLAGDLKDLMDALDLKDAALVGFSMGGGEVARYINRYGAARVSKAALVSAVTPFMLKTDDNPDGVPQKVFDDMKAGVEKDRLDFMDSFAETFVGWGVLSHPISEAQLAYNKSIAAMAQPRATLQCIDAFGTTDFRADVQKMTMPTLVVHGGADDIVPAEVGGKAAAELLPDGRLEIIDGAPHGLYLTHTERFNELLLDFLQS